MERFILGVSVNNKLVFKFYPSRCCDDTLGRVENFVDANGRCFCKCDECGRVWESIEDMYRPKYETIQMSQEAFERSNKNGSDHRTWRILSDYQAPFQKTYDEHPLPQISDVSDLVHSILNNGEVFLEKKQKRHIKSYSDYYKKWFILIENSDSYILFSLDFEPHQDFLTHIRIHTIPSQHIA